MGSISERGIYIPPEIWTLDNLSFAERILMSEIKKLAETDKGCFASNQYFSDLLGCSKESVKKYLKTLKDGGYIEILTETTSRKIVYSMGKILPPLGKILPTPQVKSYPPLGKNLPPTIYIENTSKEITSIGASQSSALEIVFPFTSNEFKTIWREWIAERRERKLKRYTPRGEQAQLHRLQKISNDDEETAKAIIRESIAQGYQGLFPLKGGTEKRQYSSDKLREYLKK